MKYSVNYSNKIKLDDFDEIIIRYEEQDRELITFLQDHRAQEVVLCVREVDKFIDDEHWRLINAIYEEHKNFSVCFYPAQTFSEFNAKELRAIAELSMPWFTGKVVTTFDQLNYLLSIGASQVYLAEDICFDLIRARRVCSAHQARIRIFPNVAQASIKTTPALKKFFLRPEDMQEYSDCVDVIEFWGPLDRQAVLKRIYEKGRWYGNLKDLILDFNISLDSRRLLNQFGKVRKTCDRKCLKGSSCAICDNMETLSHKLEDAHLLVKH